jgi:cobalt/nickel transport system permease protein
MAHIPDGVVSSELLTIGAVGTMIALKYGLKKLETDKVPQAAMLTAVFFISSLISFPIGPSSVHLLFNGLIGLMLGWAAIPVIFVALLLQLMFFGYGGLLVLGLNTFNMAVPAILVAITLRPLLLSLMSNSAGISKHASLIIGGISGGIGVGLTTFLLCFSLVLSGQEFAPMMKIILATNLPLLLIESAVTAMIVSFLAKTSPSIFNV